MSAIIWKELRENLRWALFAMLALGGAEFAALYPYADWQRDYYHQNGVTLCLQSFLLVTTFGSPLVGLLLGFVQILPELKRDRWAALLHRPVSRGTLFLGKAVAGVLLYLLAAGLPFGVCVWLAATPGHFPTPFVPGLALPGIADTCTGLVYYFAALLVALQRGGGLALRSLPILAAVHVTFFVVNVEAFADAAWAAALMILALGVAGWGAIYHQESFAARAWAGRLALLVAAFYGLCGLADFTGFVALGRNSYNFSGPDYRLSEDGRPLQLNYRDGLIASVQELDGSTPTDSKYKPDRVQSHLSYLNTCSYYIGDAHGWKADWGERSYRETSTYMYSSNIYYHPQTEQWFHLVQQPVIIGISPPRKVAVAWLDERGFEPPTAQPVPFPPDTRINSTGHDGYVLSSPTDVRFVHLPDRHIIHPTLPVPGPVYGTTTAWNHTDSSTVEVVAVALSTAVAIYDDKDAHLIATLPYHQDVSRWGQIGAGVAPTLDRFYLWYQPSDWLPSEVSRAMPSYIEEVTVQGEVLHTYTIPPAPNFPQPITWIEYLDRRLQSPAFFYGTMLYQKAGAALGSERLRNRLDVRLNKNWRRTKEIAVNTLIFSLLCAGATLYGARRARFPWPQAWRWAGLSLAFNIAGLIVFRLVADRPRLVPCAECHQLRPIDAETCPHCAKGWPEIKPTGTEIFDEAGAVAALHPLT